MATRPTIKVTWDCGDIDDGDTMIWVHFGDPTPTYRVWEGNFGFYASGYEKVSIIRP